MMRNAASIMVGLVLTSMVAVPAVARELVVRGAGGVVRLSAPADGIVRIRIERPGAKAEPDTASWAVVPAMLRTDAQPTLTATSLTTRTMRVIVDRRTLGVRIEDLAGHVIVDDAATPVAIDSRGFTLSKKLELGEHIFGFGDKTGLLDRRGASFVNWNTDAWSFQSSSDPIYKSIPFFISTGGAGGAYGVLLDNSWRSWFDFGHRRADTLAFGADGGAIDYYVIAGPLLPEVVRRYTDLTGRAPLPPRWALGYQQSRWSYGTEAEVRTLAKRLRDERVPTDVIWLDIDYQEHNRPFTIDHAAFPHFADMVHDLDGMGIKTVAIADLHVANLPGQNYLPFDSGVAGNHFVHNPDGSRYVAPVWPGPAVFPDFTQTGTRAWWGGLFKPLIDIGIAGIWNDMNEPAIFETPTKTMPLDVVHRIDGDGFAARSTTHAEVHNVYGMQNSRATYEGLHALRPDERAFVMTRASFAGGQRYAVTWTGDNSSSWDHLKLAVAQQLNLGLSGFTWNGADVGGFIGGATPELMTRWFQYAAFAPIFRDHAAKDAPRAEPWVDGPEQLAIRRRYVEARYRLLPYYDAVAENSARTGDPFMRPVFYDYPQVLDTPCNAAMSFTVGGRLLIAGSPKPESHTPYRVCLPAGGWYDYWTGARVAGTASPDGRYETVTLTPQLDTLPVFVRAGTILPRQPLVQSTQQRPDGPLELHIYPGPSCGGELYSDDGHSLGFTRGEYLRQHIMCETDRAGLRRLVLLPREGRYAAWWREIAVTVHGGGHYRAEIGGKRLAVRDSGDGASFTIADQPGGADIVLTPAS